MPTPPAPAPRLIIFDLDGVVYRGPEPIPGAAALVSALRAAGMATRFATNNSMATRSAYAERLAGHGIVARPDEIVTSTWATITHLQTHEPGMRRLLAVGADGMLAELRDAGYDATHAGDAAGADWNGAPLARAYDAVVAGLDPEVTYRTHRDRGGGDPRRGTVRGHQRRPALPDAGRPHARCRGDRGGAAGHHGAAAAGDRQAGAGHVPGHPGGDGVAPEDALVIGDNPDADMPAAQRAGIPVILVLTGVTDATAAATLEGERRPDWVAAGPAEVAALLGVTVS